MSSVTPEKQAPNTWRKLFPERFEPPRRHFLEPHLVGLAIGPRDRDGPHAVLERPADDPHGLPGGLGQKRLFLELGLFHHPMRQPAQQFELRPAALIAARPEPGLVGGHQRHAALAHAVEHQERAILDAGHQHLARGFGLHLDLAQPAAPDIRAGQARGHWMTIAKIRDDGAERLFQHPRGRRAGHDLAQRGPVEAVRRGEVRPRRDQDSAALLDVVAHVVEVDRGQDAAALVAVEDDQVEILDLVEEQLAGRKGDQAQLVDRHAVLLLGRPENGEMHQVYACIRLQKVPPGPLARMRLARDQQHPKPVAHAVDLHHGGIVPRGQLAFAFGHRELDHVHAAVAQRDRQFQILADRHDEALRLASVHGDLDLGLGRRARHRALVLDPKRQRHRLADDGEGGRVLDQ